MKKTEPIQIECKHLMTARSNDGEEHCRICGAYRCSGQEKWHYTQFHKNAILAIHLLGVAVGMAGMGKPLSGQLLKNADGCIERAIHILTGKEP
jgi:hypothetical protein